MNSTPRALLYVIATAFNPVIATAFNPVIATAFNPVIASSFNPVIASAFNPVIASAFCEAIPAATIPADADTLLVAARTAFYDGAYDRTITLLQSSGSPRRSPEADYYLGSAFASLNDPANALRYLRAAVDSAPGVIAYRFQLARSLVASGRPAEAGTEYRRILAADSTYLPAVFNLGTLCFDSRDYRGACDLFTRTVCINPRDYLAYYDLGASLVNLGHGDSAMQFLHASTTLNSRFIPSLTLLASLYYKKKQYDAAARLYQMVAARDSMIAENWARWGNCMEKLRDWSWMAHCFRTALAIDTANASYSARLGEALFEEKKYDSAAAAYLYAGSLDTENPVPYLNAGLAYASMDSTVRALAAFRRAYTGYHVERIGFLYGQIAGVQYKRKDYGHAEESYLKSLRYDPANSRALFFLARAREELRKYGPAAAAYRQFLKRASGERSMEDLVRYARKRVRQLPSGQ